LPAPDDPDAALPAWHQEYAGLSEEEVAEVDRIDAAEAASCDGAGEAGHRVGSLLSRGIPTMCLCHAVSGQDQIQYLVEFNICLMEVVLTALDFHSWDILTAHDAKDCKVCNVDC